MLLDIDRGSLCKTEPMEGHDAELSISVDIVLLRCTYSIWTLDYRAVIPNQWYFGS